jgi:predicted nucleic acid-binding protein
VGKNCVKLVDTSAWVEYLRSRQSEVAAKVESLLLSDEAALCEMVMLELWNGARGQEEKRKLTELSSAALYLEINAEVWKLAHRLASLCRDHGNTIPAADILVAACAVYHRVEMEHKDSHFDTILPLAKSL